MASLCSKTRTMGKRQCCTPPPVELDIVNVPEDLACLDNLTKQCVKTFFITCPLCRSFLKTNYNYLSTRPRIMI